MKEKLRAQVEKINALETRQRVFILAAIVVCMNFVWDAAFMQPLDKERKALESSTKTVRAELAQFDTQMLMAVQQVQQDPNIALKERAQTLQQVLARLAQQMTDLTAALVPPNEMARALEDVLTQNTPLRLVSLSGLGAEPIGAGEGERAVLYRHRVRLVLEGSYLETLAYLRSVEALSWRFLWEQVDIRVTDYPTAQVTLDVFTLSKNPVWIGV